MKKIQLKNRGSDSFYAGERECFFCGGGIEKILGSNNFETLKNSSEFHISFKRICRKGAVKISVNGRNFKSKFGERQGCNDHPHHILLMLGDKSERNPFDFKGQFDFYFWVKP